MRSQGYQKDYCLRHEQALIARYNKEPLAEVGERESQVLDFSESKQLNNIEHVIQAVIAIHPRSYHSGCTLDQ